MSVDKKKLLWITFIEILKYLHPVARKKYFPNWNQTCETVMRTPILPTKSMISQLDDHQNNQ